MMLHEELEDAVPLYAVGALERTERQALEAHLLSGCPGCHTALKEHQSVAGLLPFGLPLTQPPRVLKAKIMAARTPTAATESAIQPPNKPSLVPGEWMNHLFPPESPAYATSFAWVAATTILALLASGGYLIWNSYAQIAEDSTKLAQLQTQINMADSKLTAVQQQLTEREQSLAKIQDDLQRQTSDVMDLKDQLLQREAELEDTTAQLAQRGGPPLRAPHDELGMLLRTPNVNAISMAGTTMTKQAAGILLFDARSKKAWLYSINLPACPDGTTYQVWAMYGKPVSIGMFQVDNGETSHLFVGPLPNFKHAKNFFVSLETDAGRSEPSGPVYLSSQLP
ncbi:MAG: anti-sigma factor, partial [Nitrospira sp.]|nr:anti-sigma factor [Nitrospira sp.]